MRLRRCVRELKAARICRRTRVDTVRKLFIEWHSQRVYNFVHQFARRRIIGADKRSFRVFNIAFVVVNTQLSRFSDILKFSKQFRVGNINADYRFGFKLLNLRRL